MNETYLLLIGGVVAGILSAVIGGVIFYANLLKTRSMLQGRVAQEKIALYNDISEFDEKEFLETEAGKNLVALLKDPDRDLKDPLENFGTGLRRHNRDLVRQLDEARKKLAQSEQTKQDLGVAQSRITDLERSNKDLLKQLGAPKADTSTASLKLEEIAEKDLHDIIQKARMDTRSQAQSKNISRSVLERPPEFATNEVSIYADREALKQILIHLNLNAIAASPANGEVKLRMQIEVDNKTGKEYVVFQFSEAGGSIFSVALPIAKNVKPGTSTAPLKLEKLGKKDLYDILLKAMDTGAKGFWIGEVDFSSEFATNEVSMDADREALKKIFVHLLQNAIAVSPGKGTVNLRMQIEVDSTGTEYVVFLVSDKGGGIAPTDVPRVFTHAYGPNNRIQGVGETGTGLSTAKTLAIAQKGDIEAKRAPGGALFRVLLPIAKRSAAPLKLKTVTSTAPSKLEKLDKKDLYDIVLKAMDTGAKGFWIGEVDFSPEFATNEVSMDADREALKKIFVHLLQNAIAASPVKGTVNLRMQIEVDNTGKEYFVFQVSDKGGGISDADTRLVFAGGSNPIQGVGNTGALSSAKTLTEAQKGQIRLKRVPGGAIFNVAFPIA